VRSFFGPRLALMEVYAAHLAGAGVQRGLLGPREVPRLWERHLLNCAVVTSLVPPAASVIDVGSGAGLPGLVWAVCRPDLQITALEPQTRRVGFLRECVASLGLTNVEVRRGRAQDVTGVLSAEVVTARAVAPLARLAAWTAPLVRTGGQLIAFKGERAAAELAAAEAELTRIGLFPQLLRVGQGVTSPPTTVVRLWKRTATNTR
jgi:16S rRNA (guanine527-N7)-methyltransferase